MIKSKINQIKTNSYQRRQVLIEAMNSLDNAKINCAKCPGHCCTFVGNSMQVTTVETLDLYFYLVDNSLWNEELMDKLKKNIIEFRLNHRPLARRGLHLRKTYTCPFFLFKSKGCPIPPQYKPYGCLGFNPRKIDEQEGKQCSSLIDLLQEREKADLCEDQRASDIRNQLDLSWDKETIPVALLDVHQAILALSLHIN